MRLDTDRRNFFLAMGALGFSAGIHITANNLFDPERSDVGNFSERKQLVRASSKEGPTTLIHSHWNTEADNVSSALLLRALGYKIPVSTDLGFIRNGTELESMGIIHGTVASRYDYTSPLFYVFDLAANRLRPGNIQGNNTTPNALRHIFINADNVEEILNRVEDMI